MLTTLQLMDSMDWFDPADTTSAAFSQVLALNKVLKIGGRVFFRSAARKPWYADLFENNGFEAKRVGLREGGNCIDR
jgi:betaine lipid synthase